jgi:hypothetical protein
MVIVLDIRDEAGIENFGGAGSHASLSADLRTRAFKRSLRLCGAVIISSIFIVSCIDNRSKIAIPKIESELIDQR